MAPRSSLTKVKTGLVALILLATMIPMVQGAPVVVYNNSPIYNYPQDDQLARISNGTLYGLVYPSDRLMDLYISHDDGATWTIKTGVLDGFASETHRDKSWALHVDKEDNLQIMGILVSNVASPSNRYEVWWTEYYTASGTFGDQKVVFNSSATFDNGYFEGFMGLDADDNVFFGSGGYNYTEGEYHITTRVKASDDTWGSIDVWGSVDPRSSRYGDFASDAYGNTHLIFGDYTSDAKTSFLYANYTTDGGWTPELNVTGLISNFKTAGTAWRFHLPIATCDGLGGLHVGFMRPQTTYFRPWTLNYTTDGGWSDMVLSDPTNADTTNVLDIDLRAYTYTNETVDLFLAYKETNRIVIEQRKSGVWGGYTTLAPGGTEVHAIPQFRDQVNMSNPEALELWYMSDNDNDIYYELLEDLPTAYVPEVGPPNTVPTITPTAPADEARFYHEEDITFSWTYFDADGDPQAFYQVQVDDNSDFSSITYDTTKTASASTSHTMTSSLVYGTYYWRGYVWDDQAGQSLASASRTLDVGHRLEVRYHNESGPIIGLDVEVVQTVSGQAFDGVTNSSGWIRAPVYEENTTVLTSLVNASFIPEMDFLLVLNPGLVGSGGPAGPAPGAFSLYQFYNVSLASLPTGTNTSGGTYDLRVQDGSSQIITEVVGVPGFDIRYNWTGLPANLTALSLFFYGEYDGNPAHEVYIKVFNQVDEVWSPVVGVWESGDLGAVNYSLSNLDEEFILDGELWVQMIHETSGVGTHTMTLDYVQLRGVRPVLSGGSGSGGDLTTWSLWILFLVNVLLCSWWWMFDGPLESGALAMVALVALAFYWLINAGANLKPVSLVFGLLAVYIFIQVFMESWGHRDDL